MIDPLTLYTFIPAALALNLTPGVDMMFCLGLGLRSGARPAVAASAGISAGGMVHVTLAGLGLGAVIATLPWVFDIIRWIGVGYLLWLARGALKSHPVAGAKIVPKSAARAFRDGMFVNLANPKVILFVLAFIPQFIDPARGGLLGQFLIYGLVLSIGGFLINSGVGIFASGLGRKLTGSPRLTRGLGYVSAGIFTALAARLALIERA